MKKKLLNAFFALALFTGSGSYAQVSSYSFTQSVGSYGAPNTGSLVGTIFDDDEVTSVGLPFTFNYNGTPYTSINLCPNGYMSFGSLSGTEYTALSDNSTQNVIAPFAQDMVMATFISGDFTTGSNVITNASFVGSVAVGDSLLDFGFDFGGYSPTVTAVSGNNITVNLTAQNTISGNFIAFMNGSLRQMVTGVAPNRICEFEFKNLNRWSADESINFKVKLHETSNLIEFIYGPMFASPDNFNSEVGLKGNSSADFNSRYVATGTSWSSSVPAANIFDDCDFSNLNVPVNGLKYAWSQVLCVTPTLNITQTNTLLCSGQTATISASGAVTYSWSTGSSSTQITVNPMTTTNYTVTGFDAGCSSSVVVTQSVVATPTINITQTSTVICAGQSVSLTANGAASYTWSTGSNSAQLVVSPSASSVYVVSGSTLGCVSSASISQNVSVCTGIEQTLAGTKQLSVYPNPSTGNFVVKTSSQEAGRQLTIYNVLGAIVHSQAAEGSEEISVNASLPAGVYYVELSGNGSKQVKQIVITR